MIRVLSGKWIGRLRRLFFVNRTSRWNAWVRDVTAELGVVGLLCFGFAGCGAVGDTLPTINLLQWLVSGEPEDGATGPIGPQGVQGERGADGIGIDGSDGQDGRDGAAGAPGADGNDGDPGATGPQGIGSTGPSGSPGRDGKDGHDGADGRDGNDGIDGLDGEDGADGEDGINDLRCDDGFQGLLRLRKVEPCGSAFCYEWSLVCPEDDDE